jgi:transcriptional regulator with PAS, ATPase and Fis domain
MDPALQAKLLRVIQDGIVRRVGSTTTDAVVNVRLIAATNHDPEEAIAEGKLRKDLYFRLNVVPIHLPPLREREADIPILARMFFARFWNRHRDVGTPPPAITEDAIRELKSRLWPGNVRELQNVMEQAVVLFEGGTELRAEHLSGLGQSSAVIDPAPSTEADPFAPFFEQDYKLAREQLVSEFERKYLARVLQLADGSLTRAAAIARVDRTTLYRLMQRRNLTMGRLLREEDPDPEDDAPAD